MQGMGLNCHECTEVQKSWRGCREEVEQNEFVFEDVPLKRCPMKLMNPVTVEYIHFYNFFEKSFLPNLGSILDQPNKYMEMIIIVQGLISKKEREERKEQEQHRKHLG